jgi:phosphomannomutase
MDIEQGYPDLYNRYVATGNHRASDYFGLIRALLEKKLDGDKDAETAISQVYELVRDEIIHNSEPPVQEISFGTSGWRGVLGKDVCVNSVQAVTRALIGLYESLATYPERADFLGVDSLDEARRRGCLLGYDNRFGGEILARAIAEVLVEHGFKVYWAGESATGVLSAALLELGAAFSVNLTPSHNPLEYGGYKYNAADGGPAAGELTTMLTDLARQAVAGKDVVRKSMNAPVGEILDIDALALWQRRVIAHKDTHGIDYQGLISNLAGRDDLALVIDSVHGASRIHLRTLLAEAAVHLTHLRAEPDVSFGGIGPEPSSANMSKVTATLRDSDKALKVGAIIDPDADRIRFTDGSQEISMNQFGAMAYYYLHQYKHKRGMVAKTVATSNLANAVARGLDEQVYETKVGFKEFKPVIGKALVCFEESDGISIIGHTPEKDAYIGLLLALDMVVHTGMNLGALKEKIEQRFGAFYPVRDGVVVSKQGAELLESLALLEKYREGSMVRVGTEEKEIKEVIDIDGRKMIFADDSWIMIRASGTEPKVRFYVESRTEDGAQVLVDTARMMMAEAGLL